MPATKAGALKEKNMKLPKKEARFNAAMCALFAALILTAVAYGNEIGAVARIW